MDWKDEAVREGVAEGERRFKDGPGWRRNLGELKGDGCRRHDEEGTRPAERGERRQKKGRKEESPNRRGAVGIADSVCVHGVCLATLALSLCGSRCHCLPAHEQHPRAQGGPDRW